MWTTKEQLGLVPCGIMSKINITCAVQKNTKAYDDIISIMNQRHGQKCEIDPGNRQRIIK